ncbi:MAG: hypothetical protein LBD03_04055 [Methanobrevibacter sp.]|nr:hypothetical protein [Candidatus Methanovirga procula]
MLNKSSGLGIAGADLRVSVGGRNGYLVRTDDSGCVNLSDPLYNINYFFYNAGEYNLTINYEGDDFYTPSIFVKSIRVNRFDFQLSVNSINDVVSVGDKLSGVVKLVNKSSGLGVAGADLNVSFKVLKGGLSYSKVLSTNSDGGIDLSNLDYNFTVDGKYNLSVTYNGDNYYESSNISKMFAVHPLPVPFNGTFHPFGDDKGHYNVLLDNSRGSVLDDSVVLYNMSEALNEWIIDGILFRNAKAKIDDNILTINWNVSKGVNGYVNIYVKKVK